MRASLAQMRASLAQMRAFLAQWEPPWHKWEPPWQKLEPFWHKWEPPWHKNQLLWTKWIFSFLFNFRKEKFKKSWKMLLSFPHLLPEVYLAGGLLSSPTLGVDSSASQLGSVFLGASGGGWRWANMGWRKEERKCDLCKIQWKSSTYLNSSWYESILLLEIVLDLMVPSL